MVWPVAVFVFVLRAIESQQNTGFDLYVVRTGVVAFLHGHSPYDLHFFIYPPSGALLLSWLGIAGFAADRIVFLLIGATAVIASGLLAVRVVGASWRGAAGAAMVLALAVFEPVDLTLGLGNVNSLILLCEVLALGWIIERRWTLAALPLGISVAIKPILVPLLLFPLLERRWRSLALAVAPIVVLSALALALNPASADFFHKTLPFLLKGDPTFFKTHNVSIAGAAVNLGVPSGIAALVRLVVGAAVLAFTVMRWRQGGERWLLVVETSCLLLIGTFLCFSIAWAYYGIYLVPLLATIVHSGALIRHPIALIGLFLVGSPDTFTLNRFRNAVEHLNEVRPTLGFACILIGMGLVLLRTRSPRGSPQPAETSSAYSSA